MSTVFWVGLGGGCIVYLTVQLLRYERLNRGVRDALVEQLMARSVEDASNLLAARYAETGTTDFARCWTATTYCVVLARVVYGVLVASLGLAMLALLSR